MKTIKIGVVYTGTTPELTQMVNDELYKELGDNIEIHSYACPDVIKEINEVNYITVNAISHLLLQFAKALEEGADVILNCCSSVGLVVDSLQAFSDYSGVPIVRIDQDMCEDAVRKGERIAVIATLSSTLLPTVETIKKCGRKFNKRIEIIPCVIEGAFGLAQEEFKKVILYNVKEYATTADVVLFAQGSMAYAAPYIITETGKVVLASPEYGAKKVKKVLQQKGLLK